MELKHSRKTFKRIESFNSNKKMRIRLSLTLFILVTIISIGFVSATDGSSNYQGVGIVGNNFTINQICYDASYITLSTIQYPDRSVNVINSNMTSLGGGAFQYNLTDVNSSGRYDVAGISDGCTNTFMFYFIANKGGKEFSTGKAISYLGFIVIILFIFFLTLWGAIKIKWKHKRDNENKVIGINHFRYAKIFLFSMCYLLIMFLFGLSYKFFREADIEGFTEFFNFVYQVFLNLLYPIMITTIIIMIVIFFTNIKLKKRKGLGL